jgi:hypothetical protein
MAKATLTILAVFTVYLGLAACKFESNNLFDNNCSQTGGFYEAGRCADYIDGP